MDPSSQPPDAGVLIGSSCRMACMGNDVYSERLVVAQFDSATNFPGCHSDNLHLVYVPFCFLAWIESKDS